MVTRCSPTRFARVVSFISLEQKVSTLETSFGSMLLLQHTKTVCNFCSLLLINFNLDLRRLKVGGNKHILVTKSEFDVEEIFGLRDTGYDVPMTGTASVGTTSFHMQESPKVAALKSMLTQLPPGDDLVRVFIQFALNILLCFTTKTIHYVRHL